MLGRWLGFIAAMGVKLLAVGHLLRHIEQQTTIAFIDPAEQTAETPQDASVFSTSAPRDIVGGLSFGKIRQFGWFFAVVEKLVEWDFHGARQFFQRLDGRNGVAIFNAGNIATQ